MKSKQFIVNLLITLTYFLFFLYSGFGQSGGDIYVALMTTLCFIVHLLVLILLKIFIKKSIKNDLLGLGIGLLLCWCLFEGVNYILTH